MAVSAANNRSVARRVTLLAIALAVGGQRGRGAGPAGRPFPLRAEAGDVAVGALEADHAGAVETEDVGVGELLTHLGFDGREIRSHRVGTIQIDGDAGLGRRGEWQFADFGRMGEGREQRR